MFKEFSQMWSRRLGEQPPDGGNLVGLLIRDRNDLECKLEVNSTILLSLRSSKLRLKSPTMETVLDMMSILDKILSNSLINSILFPRGGRYTATIMYFSLLDYFTLSPNLSKKLQFIPYQANF